MLPVAAVSQNELGGNNRGWGGYKYRKTKGKFEAAVSAALRRTAIPPATKFRRLVVTRIFGKGQRPYDEGNLVGGAKPLVDALRDAKVIVDDSPKWVQIWYRQERSPRGKEHVEVLVEELVEPDDNP